MSKAIDDIEKIKEMKVGTLTMEINIKPESIEDIKNILNSDISKDEMASKLFELKHGQKQLTIDELQSQFEKHNKHLNLLNRYGCKYQYCHLETQKAWDTWQECADVNKILKDEK